MAALQMPPTARLMYFSVIGLGLASLGILAGGWQDLLQWTPERVVLAIMLTAACGFFQIFSFTTVWRGQRLALHPDEAALLLGFVVLPVPTVVLLAIAGSLMGQLAMRKPLVKAAFNVSAQSVSTVAGALAFTLCRAEGFSVLGAALLVPPAVSLTNQAIVALFLTSLSGRRLRDAWTTGLVTTISVASATGIIIGVLVLALYQLHPLLVVAGAPAWLLLHRSMASAVHAEDELATRRALNALSTRLLDARESSEVLQLALDACEEAFAPARSSASYRGAVYGRVPAPGTARLTRIVVPLGADAQHGQGEISIELSARRPSERERFATLLGLVANHASLALARIEAAREAELQRQALARAERLSALGTLVAGIAHEVNNPLMYMGASIDLIEMDLADIESAAHAHGVDVSDVDIGGTRERIARVRTGIARIHRITNALGVVARQQRSPRRQLIRALDLVREVEALVRPSLHENVGLSVSGDADARLLGVPEELCHAVLALVQNGVDALPPAGGRVTLSCEVVGDEVALRVRDDGQGMTEDVRKEAFTPFFTTKPDGTGLGLAGVLSIVSAHGGTVRLESAPGEGTVVELRVPRAQAVAA